MPGRDGDRVSVEVVAPLRRPADDDLVVELLRGLGGLLRWMLGLVLRHRLVTAAVLAGLVLLRVGGWVAVLIPALVFGLVAVVLCLAAPAWWSLRVSGPVWRSRRRRRVADSWRGWCRRCGLELVERNRHTGAVAVWTPRLSRLRWTPGGSVLTGQVALLPGQTVDELFDSADRLAVASGARWCRVRQAGPAAAELAWLFDDPLAAVVAPLPIPAVPDLSALPVGLREDGAPWELRLAGTHLLLVGVTGAGKSSLCWSLLRALAPAVAAGEVQVWAVDGKGGMELAPGRPLFSRFAATAETGVELLEQAAVVMTERAGRMAGAARTHRATVDEPLLVVLVDEVALLTAYQPDRKLRDRADKALALLATQGRAPGVVLVAALQDPRKEVLGLRNLFPTRIGLRLDEKAQVDMVLGDGAREAGAECDKISESSRGVGYVKVDGVREPVRVRAAYLTDADIADVASRYPTPVQLAPPASPEPGSDEPVELSKPRSRRPRRTSGTGAAA